MTYDNYDKEKYPDFFEADKVKDLKISVKIKNDYYLYSPQDDITTKELNLVMMFFISAISGRNVDGEYYFTENNLLRHLKLSKD